MTIELNHTIVHSRDRWAAARAVAAVLGLPEPRSFGPFAVLELANDVSLDFVSDDGDFQTQHYAFLVSEDDFDGVWNRIKATGQDWWADPFRQRPGQVNRNDGGRGLYWEGPDGHLLEIITRPYGIGA